MTARKKDDAYFTPTELTYAICKFLKKELADLGDSPNIVEPSAGAGAFVSSARSIWPTSVISAVEINPNLIKIFKADKKVNDDWAKVAPEVAPEADLIMGNPPYSLAQRHAEAALDSMKDGAYLVYLLRLSFLCTQKRTREFWNKSGNCLYAMVPLAERPSFTGGGTDSSEYAIFVWKKGYEGNGNIFPHLWT